MGETFNKISATVCLILVFVFLFRSEKVEVCLPFAFFAFIAFLHYMSVAIVLSKENEVKHEKNK